MREYGFELSLCARLEDDERIVARQLGAAVHGRRIADVVVVEPGPAFDDRVAITPDRIPAPAVESDVGPGTAVPVTEAFDCHPERARAIADRAVEQGFFERERRGGRAYVRQTVRYPDWFDGLVGVENKPDLGRPGDLRDQLRTDVSLGVFDRVILATASHVTGAHRNRIPDEVGIWRFDPETGEREVLREPEPLETDSPGIELLDRDGTGADVRPVTAAEKARCRRRIAERAYGKGWRTYDPPACTQCTPDADPFHDADAGLPYCAWKDRIVHPAEECGPDCSGYDPEDATTENGTDADANADDPPGAGLDAIRAARTPWDPDPEGVARQQSGLDRFTE